jgi:hypothetical protein
MTSSYDPSDSEMSCCCRKGHWESAPWPRFGRTAVLAAFVSAWFFIINL